MPVVKMAGSILRLPLDIQRCIIDELRNDSVEAMINLSCACSFYRSLLLPDVVRSVPLTNDAAMGGRVDDLANRPLAKHVRELRFTGTAPGDRQGDAFSDIEAICPDTAFTILSSRTYFPHLQDLIIRFDFQFQDFSSWEDGFYIFQEEETPEQVRIAEQSQGWRALMNKTFGVIAQTDARPLKSLSIQQLPPKEISAVATPAFGRLLSSLDRFELTLWGDENGAGWQLNTLYPGYTVFASRLDRLFFDHLSGVTEFRLVPDWSCPLGLQGPFHHPLKLSKDQMPKLKVLHLQNVFVDRDFVNFIVGHADTLERVSLEDCFAGPGEADVTWRGFFEALSDAKPQRLHQLTILPVKVAFQPYSDDEDAEKLRTLLQQDSRRRLFPYGYLADKYGDYLQLESRNLKRGLAGHDQNAYDELTELIDANGQQL